MDNTEVIHTIEVCHPDKRTVTTMLTRKYNEYKEFIVDVLENSGEITIKDLIDQAHAAKPHMTSGNAIFQLLLVKLDLEARGMISIKKRNGRGPYPLISLRSRRKGKTSSRPFVNPKSTTQVATR